MSGLVIEVLAATDRQSVFDLSQSCEGGKQDARAPLVILRTSCRLPQAVIARVFTSANPTTGSQPPPEVAWVVFAHGTAFFTTPTRDLPADASLAA